jgi:hypothetical protein
LDFGLERLHLSLDLRLHFGLDHRHEFLFYFVLEFSELVNVVGCGCVRVGVACGDGAGLVVLGLS